MKQIAQLLALLLLASMTALASAQQTGRPAGTSSSGGRTGWGRHDRSLELQRMAQLQATEEQKVAYRNCVETSETARKLADRVLGPDTRWQFYSDTRPEQLTEVQAAVQDVFQVHQHFVNGLSGVQEKTFEKRLQTLERLRSDMDQRMRLVAAEVHSSRPNRIAVHKDMRRIKESLHKWRSEHQKIGKEMGIVG